MALAATMAMALPRASRGKYNKFFSSAFDEERSGIRERDDER
jgi:hypothetical protein